ncbi:ComEC/Rec2 family competence protein [Holospora undulata]|uniref:ComE operon protein 3 n=1 Tax=Holospora undulata HU1 TaxID=1321371 RepID=A0A061JIJ9_9PROT|nr:ComEC/Rec2 family competence protein [Holospora undulata]ETZ04899.1 ComE operon protein 3 [Holospora undulata HU1]
MLFVRHFPYRVFAHVKIFFIYVSKKFKKFLVSLHLKFIQEQERHILWMPFGIAMGIYGYTSLTYEPKIKTYCLIFIGLFGSVFKLLREDRIVLRALYWAVLCFSVGFLRISVYPRNTLLKKELGPFWIKGKVVSMDHTASNSGKIYPRVWIKELQSSKGGLSLPCIRLGIRTLCEKNITPGDWIKAKVKLIPWAKPLVPGGYDAQFHQFFQGVSGYGFSISPVQVVSGKRGFLTRFRHYLTKTFHEKLPYPLGAVGSALVTGDKTALPLKLRDDFSISGLSHILAISGLHLSIVAAICFFIFKWLLQGIPKLGLIISLQSLAGICSLIAGGMYACISGAGYPVQRSFILMAGTLTGMFLNRWPSSIRMLSLCGSGILLTEPHACFSLSFQLSFIATASLMTVPGEFLRNAFSEKRSPVWRRWKKNFLMMNVTTIAATCSTLPWIAFYFHQYSFQSIISNIFAVSWTSFCVMPVGLIALLSLLTPYSKEAFFLWGLTLKGLVNIAQSSTHYLNFLLFYCPMYSQWIFFAQVFCVFWWLVWKKNWRWWGIGGLGVFTGIARYWAFIPKILVTQEYMGVVQEETSTLWISQTRKGRYVISQWARILNLSHTCKEKDLQNPSIKELFETGRRLKIQYPNAITFYQKGNGWIPGILSDEKRPWRFPSKECSHTSVVKKKHRFDLRNIRKGAKKIKSLKKRSL